MTQLIIDIPDAVTQRVITALSYAYRYEATVLAEDQVTQIPNPESASDFIKRKMREKIKQQVVDYEYNLAIRTTRDEISTSVENDIVLS